MIAKVWGQECMLDLQCASVKVDDMTVQISVCDYGDGYSGRFSGIYLFVCFPISKVAELEKFSPGAMTSPFLQMTPILLEHGKK